MSAERFLRPGARNLRSQGRHCRRAAGTSGKGFVGVIEGFLYGLYNYYMTGYARITYLECIEGLYRVQNVHRAAGTFEVSGSE